MLNKFILADKFKPLITGPRDKFVKKADQVRSIIFNNNLSDVKAILLYGSDTREPVYYVFGIYYSLLKDRVLDYAITTGQHFINQHFLTEATRDLDLYGKIYSSDLLFISLSQFDYTSDYLESLLIDLVDTRSTNNKITIIHYDILDTKNYMHTTKKLSDYFLSNHIVIDLTKQSKPNQQTSNTKAQTKKASERFI